MVDQDRYPPGVPCWVDAAQPDGPAAADFYGRLFGWDMEDQPPADGPGHYFLARLRGGDVAAVGSLAGQPAPAPTAAWNTYVAVESADDTAAKVTAAGGTVLAGPFDVFDFGRTAVCADPAGAVFHLWQPGTHRGAEFVNEPNTWNWSTLEGPDVAGATAFYGAVFGWEADVVTFDGVESAMWRLPGYADALERIYPGTRQRHADAGVPPGFSDAVGWMTATTGDGPPRWTVTFAVADTDTIVARAVDLGGEVVVAPFDAGPVRAATLRDPQGAEFSVNTYNPG
ncbi:MAG: uncharacterized protein QOG82_1883 [Actinomycetota bacterium]|jgi:predicted enzyme related to lactoylglutathione lyase|nr:uncharacterized protein [Actinomycetota bacterium]